MLKSIFRLSIRSLIKGKTSVLLNLTGLSIGICSSFLIILWVFDELSYNHFFNNHENIYQVKVNSNSNGIVKTGKAICYPLYEELKSQDSGILNTCITGWTYGHILSYENLILQKEVLPVSEDFIKMLGIPVLSGSLSNLLTDPYSIVLSESLARDIFKSEDPVGKYIIYDNDKELKVTGVFKDVPRNNSFWFHALVPIGFYEKTDQRISQSINNWTEFEYQVFVELVPGADVNSINANIKDLLEKKSTENRNHEIFLHGMGRWHLYSNFENGKEAGGKIEYVRLFSATAFFILLIACINYMNLTTARSERRAREVGIRKSFGSGKRELLLHFFGESLILTLLSFIIGIILVEISLPYYNELVHKRLDIDYISLKFLLSSGCIIVLLSFLSGVYPAFYYSSYQPIKVLKGNVSISKKTSVPHTISVTVQYSFSIFLIVGMIIIYQQIQYVKKRELGYKQENLLMIPTNDEMVSKYNIIKDELLRNGLAESVTKSNQPITGSFWSETIEWKGKQTEDKVEFTSVSGDSDYVETMKIKIVEGRDFSHDLASDSSAILVNEKAVEVMGFTEPVGKTIRLRNQEWTIIGVLENVLMGSPFEAIDPLFIAMMGDWNNYITIRISEKQNLTQSIEGIEKIFKKHNPSNIFEKIFVDEEFHYKYRDFELLNTLSKLFAGLALVITCMGIFGLAAYVAEGKKKEVAIRKVLGAENYNLFLLLSGGFTKIIAFSSVVSIPVSVVFMNNFLEKYSYKVSFQWWILPSVIVFILLITLIIVNFQVYKTLKINPVNILKSD
ncbi:MAG: ABC transporter permease [Cyclobacteriaceae bacterium]|nr:ABC transporter permease [Cyclobacteriaceae bacterium]